MVLFNYSTRELTAKVVYYGPGLCGKTTNLQYIFENLPSGVKGKMLSLATKTDRTLFFDFLPIDLGEIRGMKTRIQLYTVPGQVFYNETRRLVLKGADGVVFVADSQKQMLEANLDSFRNLEENLKAHGMKFSELPLVIQFNKRDLPSVASVEDLNTALNPYNAPFYESIASTGIGVQDSLKAITKLVLLHLTRKYDVRRPQAAEASAAAPRAAASHSSRPAAASRAAAAVSSGGLQTSVAASDSSGPILRAMPIALSALPVGEGVLDLVDMIEGPSRPAMPPMREVTDESELHRGEEDRQITALGRKSADLTFEPAHRAVGPPAVRSPAPTPSRGDRPASGRTPVTPTAPSVDVQEVSEQDELFAPGATVARLDGDRPVEVVLPIEVRTGGRTRRFRLAVRLNVSELT
jgi:hypothetical protein